MFEYFQTPSTTEARADRCSISQSKRYPGHSLDREIEQAVTVARPVSLTAAELDAEAHPVSEATVPIPVRVWVRFPEVSVHPEAEAIAWNDHAVRVRWTQRSGVVQTAWVWASAVKRR